MEETKHKGEIHDLDPPEEFCCPITCDLMRDPVTTICGHTFERGSIEEWFRSHATCPYDNSRLASKHLSPNFALKQSIGSFCQKRPILTIQNQIRTDFQLAVKLREGIFVNQQQKPTFQESPSLPNSSSPSLSRPPPPSDQSVLQLVEFLESLSLSKYTASLQQEGAESVDDLKMFSEAEFRSDFSMGKIHARRLANALQLATNKSKQDQPGETDAGQSERKEEAPDSSSPHVHGFRMMAEQGNANAQHSLGICYNKGEGVTKDLAEALRWYRKAAGQGHARAQNSLGICFQYGAGVGLDLTEAARWYRMAAEQGNASAQNALRLLTEAPGAQEPLTAALASLTLDAVLPPAVSPRPSQGLLEVGEADTKKDKEEKTVGEGEQDVEGDKGYDCEEPGAWRDPKSLVEFKWTQSTKLHQQEARASSPADHRAVVRLNRVAVPPKIKKCRWDVAAPTAVAEAHEVGVADTNLAAAAAEEAEEFDAAVVDTNDLLAEIQVQRVTEYDLNDRVLQAKAKAANINERLEEYVDRRAIYTQQSAAINSTSLVQAGIWPVATGDSKAALRLRLAQLLLEFSSCGLECSQLPVEWKRFFKEDFVPKEYGFGKKIRKMLLAYPIIVRLTGNIAFPGPLAEALVVASSGI